jgi:hypothetical protein
MPVRDIRQGERKRKKKAAFGQGTGLREIAGAPKCRAPSRPSWCTRLALHYGRTHVGANKRLEKTLRPDPGALCAWPKSYGPWLPGRSTRRPIAGPTCCGPHAMRAAHEPIRSRLHDRY